MELTIVVIDFKRNVKVMTSPIDCNKLQMNYKSRKSHETIDLSIQTRASTILAFLIYFWKGHDITPKLVCDWL